MTNKLGLFAAGVADALRSAGIAVFGPNSDAARIESSKSFAKEIMASARVPTAKSAEYFDRESAVARLEEMDGPYVVKADGLAAGKGVLVTKSLERAVTWAEECLGGRFGTAGESVVIEDFLDGAEVKLTPTELQLAACVFANIGKLLSREFLLREVWGIDAQLDTRTVDMHISRIRKILKIGPNMGFCLKTVYRQGYRLEAL